ncbi:hypothetical protein Q8A73_005919 [Channa argus]|nr:hypothetical protein Q8A73_005919 [Channa argus]
MKTWCVVAVVLSLSSVCQSAPLECDKLLKPADNSPDVNGPSGDNDVLLQPSCPDCIAVKGSDYFNMCLLFSRRKTVTAAELKDFEKQAKCFGWYKPQFFNTDHGYENCKSLDDVSEVESEKNY